jgi:MFS family permease
VAPTPGNPQSAAAAEGRPRGRSWSPWRTVVAFGLVSLAADMVYEGMRAVAGPFLGSLGASALTVGLVTGAGEGIALVLRLVTGPWADRTQRHWRLTVVGYAMTAVCVPLLAITPFLGAAGVAVAATLILLERTGKAVRSPAKSALLARMAAGTGRGRGFAVHKALDQVGAFAGPLLLSGVAAVTGMLWPGLALLAVPGALSLLLLAQLRRRVPSVAEPGPEDAAPAPQPGRSVRALRDAVLGAGLPREFHLFSLAVACSTAGLMTFGVISFRFVEAGLVPLAAVPLVYAGAMAVQAVAALATGDLFDRYGGRVLLGVPLVVAAVPPLVFAPNLWPVLAGVVLWGAATGIQDSTVKAYVADLVPSGQRSTAYGVFAAVQGVGALAGGALAGALATDHANVLAGCVAGLQATALLLLLRTLRTSAPQAGRQG